ncbi:hypothetical protein SS1G_11955 [Sclerotinia sclerotiorum 1980 UF-70]|uniref:Uncharacterized protein n=1 Tax=Sclerotinia sclerotiorum (strain ATCC 18683 / 1980 / Ss-1) TaxID=665079 RepID=A7F3V9_SCLS1|nr:hypothetical protein SS1G_11955 [Sclerotinia sclerotiorum 1980 UF-70]EDN97430.1 hypothetical protein SS1G_11955 [Sclerotinia sclerotiorum 1980 UF-70]
MEVKEYEELAKRICKEEMDTVREILGGSLGKIIFLLRRMMRGDREGRVQPVRAREVLGGVVEGFRGGV